MNLRPHLAKPYAKPILFVLCLLPFLLLAYAAVFNQATLGANPAEYIIRDTGDWILRFLCITLAITPLRVMTATPQLARLRRMLGLYVFFYAVLHMLSKYFSMKKLKEIQICHTWEVSYFIYVGYHVQIVCVCV